MLDTVNEMVERPLRIFRCVRISQQRARFPKDQKVRLGRFVTSDVPQQPSNTAVTQGETSGRPWDVVDVVNDRAVERDKEETTCH